MERVSPKPLAHTNNHNKERKYKGFAPDSLPGCIGYFNKNQAECKICQHRIICQKVVPRAEVEKLLKQILELAATRGEKM